MRLAGLQKLTLLDYPGEVACTVFTQGCSLRCPFCQNPELVLPELAGSGDLLAEEEFFAFLDRRRGRLSGVAISGGEPTIQADLPQFLGRIRRMGFLAKLDTNGLRPEVLKEIVRAGLVDYVAMDVKNSPGKYAQTAGLPEDRSSQLWESARESISFLMEDHVPYEFRTTVAEGLHTKEDILEIAEALRGARAWYLQQFIRGDRLLEDYLLPGTQEKRSVLASPSQQMLEEMREAAAGIVSSVRTRGI